MSDEEGKRTYDVILKSYIKELNSKGGNLDYDKLSDTEKLELLNILASQCKEHMKPFVIHVLGYDWDWFHDIWFEMFIKYDINCIVAARGLGKSFFWTRMLTAYCAFIIPHYKTIISSYNETATFDFVKDVRTDYEDNEWIFTKVNNKEKSADWNKSNLDFKNKSVISGISITSQIRRKHVHNFVADDIINDEQKMSPEQIKAKIFLTILPVVERKRGRFQLVGTRFGEDDIYDYFREESLTTDTWNYVQFHVELDEKNEKVLIVHENENGLVNTYEDTTKLYSFRRLLILKQKKPQYFAREYECKVGSDDDVPFPLDVLLDSRDRGLSYEYAADPQFIYAGGLDSSSSTAKDADDTVLMMGRLDTDNNIVPACVYGDNTLEAPERLQQLMKYMDLFNKPVILAEKNNMGQTNIDMINKDGYRLIPFNTDRIKKNDVTNYASLLVKRRTVRFPYKTVKDQKITDKIIHQLAGVKEIKTRGGKDTYTGTTKHDDYYIGFILMVKQLFGKGRPTKVRSYSRNSLKSDYDGGKLDNL